MNIRNLFIIENFEEKIKNNTVKIKFVLKIILLL